MTHVPRTLTPITKRSHKSAKNTSSEAANVLLDTLAASLQVVYEDLRQDVHHMYIHTLQLTCQSMQTICALIKNAVIAHPELAVNALFNSSNLTARSSNKFLETWACKPLEKEDITFLGQTKPCTVKIPVQFTFDNKTLKGFYESYKPGSSS